MAEANRASVPLQSDLVTGPWAEAPVGGGTSPVLNVQQGFLSEDTLAPTDRPFQRGQRSQHPADPAADQPRQRAVKVDGSGKEPERHRSRDRAPAVMEGKHAHKTSAAAEAKHDRERSGATGSCRGVQSFVMVSGVCALPCMFSNLQSHIPGVFSTVCAENLLAVLMFSHTGLQTHCVMAAICVQPCQFGDLIWCSLAAHRNKEKKSLLYQASYAMLCTKRQPGVMHTYLHGCGHPQNTSMLLVLTTLVGTSCECGRGFQVAGAALQGLKMGSSRPASVRRQATGDKAVTLVALRMARLCTSKLVKLHMGRPVLTEMRGRRPKPAQV